jgi:hypothetical protein
VRRVLSPLVHLVIATLSAGCGSGGPGSSPSAPTEIGSPTPAILTCPPSGCAPLSGSRGVKITVVATTETGGPAPWSYTFSGLAVSGSGTNDTEFGGISPGDLEVAGQMMVRGGLSFTLSRLSTEGLLGDIVANSVQSLEGPVARVTCDGVQYSIGNGGATPQNLRFKFTLDSTTLRSGCR